jgi:flagellum-specific ATP synthase
MRAILDGHIVLTRQLAQTGQYPAIDVTQSASRVMPDIAPQDQRAVAAETVKAIALLERNRQLVDIGAYEPGANPQLDAALARQPRLLDWLCQSRGGADALEGLVALSEIFRAPAAAASKQASLARKG